MRGSRVRWARVVRVGTLRPSLASSGARPGAQVGLLVACVVSGCVGSQAQPPALPNVAVAVSRPVVREVVDYVELTGRTAPVETVEVRARVSGFLIKIDFVDGSEVPAGKTLFEIDQRPFQASLAQAKAQLDSARADLRKTSAELSRAETLIARKAISQQEYDQYAAARANAEASIEAANASIDKAKLDVEFATVKAPIAGQMGRALVTKGNLVIADSTLLSTLVSVDPMDVYFDVDERTLLRIQRMIREGKLADRGPVEEKQIPVYVGLANETGYPHEGKMDFGNNTVDASTGTIQVRAVLPNPLPKVGRRLFIPGLFVRVRVPIEPHRALVVADRAIGSDQGRKFVYVLNAEKKVETRPVRMGILVDGMREIEDGIRPDDLIIVNGLQRVRAGMVVDANEIKMPGGAKPGPGG